MKVYPYKQSTINHPKIRNSISTAVPFGGAECARITEKPFGCHSTAPADARLVAEKFCIRVFRQVFTYYISVFSFVLFKSLSYFQYPNVSHIENLMNTTVQK